MEIRINVLTADAFLELLPLPVGSLPAENRSKQHFKNSILTFAVLDQEKPVGMVRLLGDGGMSFYIKDFAVLPSYQGNDAGTLLLRSLEQYIRDRIRPGWTVSPELISTKEALSFYKKMVFEERPCEWDEPGMMKMLR